MPDISKLNNKAIGDIEKVNNIAKSSIAKVNNTDIPSAATRPRVVIVVGESAQIMWSVADDLTVADNWTLLDNGSGGYDDIAWGYDDSDNEVWILTRDQTTNPMYIAVQDAAVDWVPSGSANWVATRPNGGQTLAGQGHRVHFADTGSNDLATWAMSSVGNSEYAYYVTGTITDTSAWCVQYRAFDSVGTTSTLRPPPLWNRSSSVGGDSIFMCGINNNGSIFTSVEGTGSADNGEWTSQYNPGGSNANNKGGGGYGAGVWVVAGQQSNEDHLTGSGPIGSMTWGALNEPAANRQMSGVATNMAGTWVMCGKNGYVWKSTDNAETWAEIRLTSSVDGNHRDMTDVAYDNDGTWIIVGSRDFWVSSDLTLTNYGFYAFDPDPTANRTYNGVAFNVENSSQ